jgi:hypothetical protein
MTLHSEPPQTPIDLPLDLLSLFSDVNFEINKNMEEHNLAVQRDLQVFLNVVSSRYFSPKAVLM